MSVCENCVREYVWNGGDNPIPGECKDCQVGLDGKPTHYQRKPQTNADRIRAMSDEELARWMCGGSVSTESACNYCDKNNGEFCNGEKCRGKTDTEIIMEWLKQPAEVDNG